MIASILENSAELVDGTQAEFADDGCETPLEQVMLVVFQHNTDVEIYTLLENTVVVGKNLRII
jgi:hypothetical protein